MTILVDSSLLDQVDRLKFQRDSYRSFLVAVRVQLNQGQPIEDVLATIDAALDPGPLARGETPLLEDAV